MLAFWLIIIFSYSTWGLEEIKSDKFDFGVKFSKLLRRVYAEKPFEGVFLQRKVATDCIDKDLERYIEVPVISYGLDKTIYLKGNYSSEMLAVLCMHQVDDKELLGQLAINLQHMRNIRIIVIVEKDIQLWYSKAMTDFFMECKHLQILNINLLHGDCFRTGLFHSFTDFPEFKVETRNLQINAPFFTERLRNLRGKILITLAGQLEPLTMLYTDAKGRQRMSGYIGKLMHAFEAHYNCVFIQKYPYNLSNEHVMHLNEIRKAARNGSIDIGASLSTAQHGHNIHEYTATVELGKWIIMLPIEPPMPIYLILVHFLRADILLVLLLTYWLLSLLLTLRCRLEDKRVVCARPLLRDICCNDVSLRGLLWQPFSMRRQPTLRLKAIYFLVSLTGLFLSSCITAYVTKLLTAPPSLRQISTFDELLQSNVKIRIPAEDIEGLMFFRGAQFWHKYRSVFEIVENLKDFQQQRLLLQLPYGYGLLRSVWRAIDEQQKQFAQKLYRIAPELYISNFMAFALPMNENSFYKEPMNQLLGRVKDVGIWRHWLRFVFYDMVALKRLSFQDKSEPRIFKALNVDDFYWIWILYLSGFVMSTVVFTIEKILRKWLLLHQLSRRQRRK